MTKIIAPYNYSDASTSNSLQVLGKLGIYQYSDPSIMQEKEVLGEIPTIEIVGGTATAYQNTRSVAATIRVYDALTGIDLPDAGDVFEYSLTRIGDADDWQTNVDEQIQVLDPDSGVAAGHMEAHFVLKVRVTRDGSYIAPGVIEKEFILDEVLPVVTISPIAGNHPSSTTIELTVVDYTPATIYYTTDGTDPDINSNQFVSAFGMMSAEIRYMAIDAAGNQSAIESATYVLDDIAPLITVLPDDTLLSLGEVCNVTWHVNEYCSTVIFELGGDGVSVGTGTELFEFNNVVANDPRVTQISSLQIPNGTSTINVYAADSAGNWGQAAFDITYSSLVPTITVYEVFRPALASDETGVIIWSSDYAGDYEIRVGGANPGEGTLVEQATVAENEIKKTLVDTSLLIANAENQVKIYVTTSVGNTGSNSSIKMTVDTEAPTTVLNHDSSENPFNLPFILTITGSDNVVAGIPTDFGLDVSSEVEPLNYNFDGMAFNTEWNSGGFEYSNPSTLQALQVYGYQYSPPSIIQPLNVQLPIIITNVAVMPAATTATVTWTTDRNSNSSVYYGEQPDLSDAITPVSDASLVTSHSIGIVGLQENTAYYYKVVSGSGGYSEESGILSFSTTAVIDLVPPTISNVVVEALSGTEILVTWETDEQSTSSVMYGQQSDLSDGVMTAVSDIGGVLVHSVVISGLQSNTEYFVRAFSSDGAANEAFSNIFSATTWDVIAPVISNVVVDSYRTTALIRWETDEPTIGWIEYGTTTGYGFTANELTPDLKTSHEVILQSLTPDRLYHFNIISEDTFGNQTSVFDRQLTTFANRDARVTIYATTDGSEPTTSNYGFRSVGLPLNINIDLDTVVKYFAADGFGNHQAVETEAYVFDVSIPVITFDSMTPILLGGGQTSVIRFKVSEITDYVIINQEDTVLASGISAVDTWIDAVVSSDDMVESYNHITIRATDQFAYTGILQIGHIIKDTIPAEVVAMPPAGYFKEDVFVDLMPQNLRTGEQITIYYTTDGTMPDLTSQSALGQVNDIQISDTATIRWFSVDETGNIEAAKYAHYVIDRIKPTVTASPLPGTYDEVLYVTLTPSEPGLIYYTINGSVPTENSSIYTSPIQVLRDTTIRCFAKDLAGNVSDQIYTFEYRIQVLQDKRFKKVIGFQDKMLLETEVNEMQDNLNRRIEEFAGDVIGKACTAYGFDLTLSEYTFEFFVGKGRAYIGGKFISIVRGDQDFIPKPMQGENDKTYHIVIRPNEPIFRPIMPGQPGWETGVPEITSYRLEESYILEVVEELPDVPHMELYEVFRPFVATRASDCTVIEKIHRFESLCEFQARLNQTVSEMQANFLALGLEIESYKVRNLLGLKNAFVDTFESVIDVDLSKSTGFKYENTRFEL